MEVIRFKSMGDMSGLVDVHSRHFLHIKSEDVDPNDHRLDHLKNQDQARGKWASCKLLGFRQTADECEKEGRELGEEVVQHRHKSTGDFLAQQRESCPLEDANWMLMLASLANKSSNEVSRREEDEEEDGSLRRPAKRAASKWRASGARRKKVAAKLTRLALSSPLLAVGQQQVQGTELWQFIETSNERQQQRAVKTEDEAQRNNGQFGGAEAMIVVASKAGEGATQSDQPMETSLLKQAARNDSQQQLQVTVCGDQHNAASDRQQQQQQVGDNGNDFAAATTIDFDGNSDGYKDRDGDGDNPQIAGRGVGSTTKALPQTQVRLGVGAASKAQIDEKANACAPSSALAATTTLEATRGNILPISHLAKQQQQSSDAVDYAGGGGDGEPQAQAKQQVSHAHLSQQHRHLEHHRNHRSTWHQDREREQRKVDGGGGEYVGETELACADSGRILVVEMVGQHWLHNTLAGHQQQVNANYEGDKRLVQSNGAAGKLAELNIGAAANRLVGSFCSAGHTWRQALQPPSHSGTYKVALREQQAAFAISGTSLEVERCGSGISKQEMKFGGQQATATTGRRVMRHPRPGRSPISLQRQTNARLAKHRARIQQQRQEQLAQLALSERQQLGGHQFSGRQEQEGGMQISEGQHHSDLYIINDRLPPTAVADSTSHRRHHHHHQCRSSTSSRPSTSAQAFRDYQHQPQVISPTTSTAIEICDNQQACTSSGSRRHNSSRGFNLSRLPAAATTNAGNVIVYKSINMFRNNPLTNETTKGVSNDQDDAQTISSSGSTLSLSRPFCKICHMGSSRTGDKLISPCKCSGTMQYIHCGCLLKWLEISNRTNDKPMSCELCAHEYSWHKMFNYKHLRWPRCSLKDIFLHIVFVLALGVMIYSAIAPILQRKTQDNIASPSSSATPTAKLSSSASGGRERQQLVGSQFYHASLGGRSNHLASGSLASDEKLMLLCAASFFISFFLAIYVQTKARDTLYGLFVKFLNLNQTYYITEYDHGNSAASKQFSQQQQQQHAASCPRNYRKSGQEELING